MELQKCVVLHVTLVLKLFALLYMNINLIGLLFTVYKNVTSFLHCCFRKFRFFFTVFKAATSLFTPFNIVTSHLIFNPCGGQVYRAATVTRSLPGTKTAFRLKRLRCISRCWHCTGTLYRSCLLMMEIKGLQR